MTPTSTASRPLLELLAAHSATDEKERADLAFMREQVATLAEPLSADQPGAHFTASAVVALADGERVCLIHHKKLGRWLQPGGHVEAGDGGSMARAALREVREETGLVTELHAKAPLPLDVDVHRIPARGDRAEHLHLDVRFLVVAGPDAVLRHDPEEVGAAAVFTWDEAIERIREPASRRMFEKARAVMRRSGR